MESIEDKTLREMVGDRDDALARKDRELAKLHRENENLKESLRDALPLSDEDGLVKKRMEDWTIADAALRRDTGRDASVTAMVMTLIENRNEQAEIIRRLQSVLDSMDSAGKQLGEALKKMFGVARL